MPGFDNGCVYFEAGIDPRGTPPVVNQMGVDGRLLIGSSVSPYVVCNTLTAPAAGISITGGPGTITFALANDLLALESLATTGVASRTGASTWTTSSITQNAVIVGGAGQALANIGPLTNGQLVIGSTGVAPVAASLSAGTGIGIANAAGSITVSVTGAVATTYNENAGSATPAANTLSILGGTSTGGAATNINTSGAGSTVSVCLNNSINQPTTNNTGTAGVYYLDGNRFLHNFNTTFGINGGNTFLGHSAGNFTNDTPFQTGLGTNCLAACTTGAGRNTAVGAIALSSNTSGETNVAVGVQALQTTTTQSQNTCVGYQSALSLIGSQNTALGFAAAQGTAGGTGSYNTALGWSSMQTVKNGGSNSAVGASSLVTMTDGNYNSALGNSSLKFITTGSYNLALGNSAGSSYTGAESSNISLMNVGTVGESNVIRIGTQGAGNGQQNACYIAGIAGVVAATNNLVTINTSTGQLGSVAQTNGQLMIGSTAASPVAAGLTPGAGISITSGAGSITVSSWGGGMSWTTKGASTALVVNNAFICTAGAALSFSLPLTSSVGDEVALTLDGSTSWTITQAANQQIRFGAVQTTLGAGGSLASTAQGDTVTLVCSVANLKWNVISSIGTISVV